MKLATLASSAIAAAWLLFPTVSGNDHGAIQLRNFINDLTERYPFLTNDEENNQDAHGVQQFTRDVENFLSAYSDTGPLLPRGFDVTPITVTVACFPQRGSDLLTSTETVPPHQLFTTCCEVNVFETFRSLEQCPTFQSAYEKCLGQDKLAEADYFVDMKLILRHVDDSMLASGVGLNSHIAVLLHYSPLSDVKMAKVFSEYINLHC